MKSRSFSELETGFELSLEFREQIGERGHFKQKRNRTQIWFLSSRVKPIAIRLKHTIRILIRKKNLNEKELHV